MRKIAILILSGILLGGLVFDGVWAAQTFTGKANAVVIDGDKLAATKLAYQSALKKAVSAAMRFYIYKGSEDEMAFNLKKNELLKGPFDFVVEEKQTANTLEDNLLTIELAVTVDETKLKSFLGQEGVLVTANKDRKKSEFPKVMVMMIEDLNGAVNSSPYSAGVIRRTLLKNKFDVVDEKLVAKSISHDQAVAAVMKNDIRTAQAAALQYGSGVIIKGRASAQASGTKSGGMQAFGATVILEAVKVDTGAVIASVSADGSYPHINAMTGSKNAIEEAAAKAVDQLIAAMEEGFKTSTGTLVVLVSDINYAQLAVLKRMLKRDFSEISQIKQDNFNGNIAKLELVLQAGATEFADKLALKDFGTFKLRVLNFSPGKIDTVLEMKAGQ